MQSQKKILFILHLPPPVHGAAMVGKWIKESQIINNAIDGRYLNLSTSESLQDIGKGGVQKLISFLKVVKKVIIALFQRKHDLCYMTITAKGPGFYKDACIVFILKFFRKKIIYHFHNKGVRANSDGFVNKQLYKFVFKNTKSILLSKYLYNDISQFVDEKNVLYCPNGIKEVDYDFSKTISNVKLATPCKFLFLSNMMEEKGVYVLLEACAILKQKKVAFECHFIGAWSDVTENLFWDKVSELDLRDTIFAHGKKYNEDKFEFFKNSDVFVFPTYYHNETFGLVLVEAMQAGLPVVSTNEGGIPDVVKNGETGLLVEKRNSHELAEKLELLSSNYDLRKRMGLAGRKRYEQHFTMSIFEKNLLDVLQG